MYAPPMHPPIAAAAAPPAAAPAVAGLSAVDLRLIVKEMIDQAVMPLQMRIAELERRPRAASSPAFVAAQVATAPATPQAVVHPAAMIAPAAVSAAPAAPRSLVVAPPPLLDVKAIEREIPMDLDMKGFDGGKRKRRAVIAFVFVLLLLFGGLFAMLASSYSPQH